MEILAKNVLAQKLLPWNCSFEIFVLILYTVPNLLALKISAQKLLAAQNYEQQIITIEFRP